MNKPMILAVTFASVFFANGASANDGSLKSFTADHRMILNGAITAAAVGASAVAFRDNAIPEEAVITTTSVAVTSMGGVAAADENQEAKDQRILDEAARDEKE